MLFIYYFLLLEVKLTPRLEPILQVKFNRLSMITKFTKAVMVHCERFSRRRCPDRKYVHRWLSLCRNIFVVVADSRESVVLVTMLTIEVVLIGDGKLVDTTTKPALDTDGKNWPWKGKERDLIIHKIATDV